MINSDKTARMLDNHYPLEQYSAPNVGLYVPIDSVRPKQINRQAANNGTNFEERLSI